MELELNVLFVRVCVTTLVAFRFLFNPSQLQISPRDTRDS